ncbi:hypothetical protein QFC19_008139 [Naganishia cerealis]|uniref:Uncharacterized protein n=1 Tax=Naganishia cerealis TaxID=610337 RepID=A0ACC2V3R4_9TREE|nr:hypothetical protein QFC19_008139 [Naganishia cerealis]
MIGADRFEALEQGVESGLWPPPRESIHSSLDQPVWYAVTFDHPGEEGRLLPKVVDIETAGSAEALGQQRLPEVENVWDQARTFTDKNAKLIAEAARRIADLEPVSGEVFLDRLPSSALNVSGGKIGEVRVIAGTRNNNLQPVCILVVQWTRSHG